MRFSKTKLALLNSLKLVEMVPLSRLSFFLPQHSELHHHAYFERPLQMLDLTFPSFVPSCDCKNNLNGLCQTDPTMGELKTRVYDVIMTASDSATNTASDTCQVIVVPFCDSSADPNDCEVINGALYFKKSAVNASVDMSQRSYVIAEEELVWQSGLELPDPEEEADVSVDVDIDPPEVSCSLGTQGLLGNGAGVFTDLGFNFTAVDGGKKCTNTEDLVVTIEVLSNEVVVTGEEVSLFLTSGLKSWMS